MRISDWSSDVCSSDLQVLEELLGHARVLGQVREGDLRLDHPELGQAAGGVGVLGAEGRAEGVDLAQGQAVGLAVQLARYGEEGFLDEEFALEVHVALALARTVGHVPGGGAAYISCPPRA